MRFIVSREALIGPLMLVANVSERRSTMLVLSNILIQVRGQELLLLATDTEVEMLGRIRLLDHNEEGSITVPAKKFLDLVKSLPDENMIECVLDADRLIMRSGRSKFSLSTLPAEDFPQSDAAINEQKLTVSLPQGEFKSVLNATAFAIAVQDVRYYLNGMLLEVSSDRLRTVATDGHRLSLADVGASADTDQAVQSILPRKAVHELQRLLEPRAEEIRVVLTDKFIRVDNGQIQFTSNLIEGRFPDYHRVVPTQNDLDLVVDRSLLKATLARIAILTHEKSRGVRLVISENLLAVFSVGDEEQGEETLQVEYQGPDIEIGLNVGYLLDVLNAIDGEQVLLQFKDNTSSVLVRDFDAPDRGRYVVMPMRF